MPVSLRCIQPYCFMQISASRCLGNGWAILDWYFHIRCRFRQSISCQPPNGKHSWNFWRALIWTCVSVYTKNIFVFRVDCLLYCIDPYSSWIQCVYSFAYPWVPLFKCLLDIFYAYECFASMYVCVSYVCQVPMEVRCPVSWNSSYKQLSAALQVLGIKPRSSTWAASTFNHWATSSGLRSFLSKAMYHHHHLSYYGGWFESLLPTNSSCLSREQHPRNCPDGLKRCGLM